MTNEATPTPWQERVARANAMAENDRYMQSVAHLHSRRWRYYELRAWISYVSHATFGIIGNGGLS